MTIRHIACCTDFSENAEVAVATAIDLADKYKARLFILHVMPPAVNPMLTDTEWVIAEEPRSSLVLKLKERMQNTYADRIPEKLEHELIVLDGHVSTEILGFLTEKSVDLAVMGSFGFTGMGLVVFGSVAKRVSHKAPCSVMIVRNPEADRKS
ncbi:MAG: universal stress protein [Desulfobacteraceae bacterium]|nr:universal stress protein [Desulfobacteraceae bacterium]